MHDWGVINFLSEVKTHSDTYYLSKFVEEKKCDSLDSIADILGKLIRSSVNIWVVCVVDTQNDTILLVSDGCRSLYIDTNIDETIMNSFSSLDDSGRDEYFFKGYVLLDFNGNISKIQYDYINKIVIKPIKYTQPALPYASGYSSLDEADDDYFPKKKEEKDDILTVLGDSINWKDNLDWIDPALVIDSADLTAYLAEFWELETDLTERKASWFWQWWVWDSTIKALCTTANLIYIEMNDLVDTHYALYTQTEVEGLYEYVEHETMGIMDIVLEYSPNFEFED